MLVGFMNTKNFLIINCKYKNIGQFGVIIIFRNKLLKISLSIILLGLFPLNLFGNEKDKNTTNLNLESPSAVLIDGESGKILFEKNGNEVRSATSLMKIMNLLIAAEALEKGDISLNEKVSISENSEKVSGAGVWLKENESVSVEDLIKAIALVSANDACVALTEHMKESEGSFVSKMNQKASKLQMNNTIFKDCIGGDDDGNVSTAYDISIMAKELLKHENVSSCLTTWIDHIRNGETQIVNTNKLLKSFKGSTGIKTGTSEKAGSCIAASAEKNGVKLVAVILGAKDVKERDKEIISLLNYGFDEFIKITPKIPENFPETLKIKNGMKSEISIYTPVKENFLIHKSLLGKITSNINLPEEIAAPVDKNQKIGEITYSIDNNTVYNCNINSSNDVEKINFKSVLKCIMIQFFKM